MVLAAMALLCGPAAQAAPLPGPCPLFAGPGDPVFCQATLTVSTMAVSTPAAPAADAAAVIPRLDDDMFAMLLDSGGLPELPPLLPHGAFAADAGFGPAGFGTAGFGYDSGPGLTVSRSDDAAGRLSAAYDLPFAGDLQLRSRSAFTGAPGGDDALGLGVALPVQAYDASSSLSLVYAAAENVTLAVEPAVASTWSDAAAGQTRVGIGNRLTTALADDLSLVLSAGYDSVFFAEDPLQNYRAMEQRIVVTWGAPQSWRGGLTASSRSEWSFREERRLLSPGLFVTMPLAADVSLTARNEFGFSRSHADAADGSGREDYRNRFGLQAVWRPAVAAGRALRVMLDYSLSYDSTRAAEAGLNDDVSLYATLARLAVALRF